MNKELLIVDDDPSIIIAVKMVFEEEGYKVHTANSGMECISELENGFKGVILMDIMMPKMDGWDTIEEIVKKDLHKGNIIAMLTAKDIPDIKMNPLKEYVTDYLTKPFEAEEIVDTVNEYNNLLNE